MYHRIVFALLIILNFSTAYCAQRPDIEIVDADFVGEHLDEWIIIDARPNENFRKGHIPLAINLYWEVIFDEAGGDKYNLPPLSSLSKYFAAAGISQTSPLIVYGNPEESWGGEGWLIWTLATLGHEGPIRFFDGGIGEWRKSGGTVATGKGIGETRGESDYKAEPRKDFFIDAAEVSRFLDHDDFSLIDTRIFFERFLEKIPNSSHFSWKDLYAGEYKKIISRDKYLKLLGEAGWKEGDRVVFYCTGGVRSAYAWLIHYLYLGGTPMNLDGGFEAWDSL